VTEKKLSDERIELLADVAEQYFIEGKTQAQIARFVGVTRSMVSRMLTEARQAGIVQIEIRRPLGFNRNLQAQLKQRVGLMDAYVLNQRNLASSVLKEKLGIAGAFALKSYIKPGTVFGVSWGTTITSVVNAISPDDYRENESITVVQLIGALGAQNSEYDAHALVANLQQKFKCGAVYLNAPYLVESSGIATSFLATKNVAEGIEKARHTDVALLGIGSTDISTSSFYLSGYVTKEEILEMVQAGAVGDVCGFQVDEFGNGVCDDFQARVIGISLDDFLRIPIRIGVAGGPSKILPLLGGLRSGYLNILVTDIETAQQLLELDKLR
jgi:DNA-binding transcriptional regulator LsrR (DeoR family)